MPKYLCLQRNLSSSPGPQKPSPAEMQAMYGKFNAWRAQFEKNIVDLGGRLGKGSPVAEPAPEGPFVEVKELVGGYMFVDAPPLDDAAKVGSACPGLLRPGSGVEVIEILTPG